MQQQPKEFPLQALLNKIIYILRKPVRDQKGVALLIAIFSITLMIFLAQEVSYETNVEYVVSAQKVKQLKARYAAKAGVEISLLRILLYKKALATYGEQLGAQKNMLDPIWSFPFAWPPSGFLPESDRVSAVARDQIKKVEEESEFDASYITSISSEGGNIDVNDLGSDIESLRDSVGKQILKIFDDKMEADEDFNEKYSDVNFNELVNHMIDWVDADKKSRNGGEESSYYTDFKVDAEFLPPNQPFRSFDEMHMVAGMKDDFVKLLKNRVTVFGIKGVNINYASKEMLKALDSQITDEVAGEIIKRRTTQELGGPFKDEDEFVNFLSAYIGTAEFNSANVPLLFGEVFNFRIESTGEYGKSVKEIEVITYDIENITDRFVDLLDKQDKEREQPNEGDPPTDTTNPDQGTDPDAKATETKKKTVVPVGRPRIVYWQET